MRGQGSTRRIAMSTLCRDAMAKTRFPPLGWRRKAAELSRSRLKSVNFYVQGRIQDLCKGGGAESRRGQNLGLKIGGGGGPLGAP